MGKGYVRKRGENSWQVAVYVGQDENGKDKYDYRTVHATKKKEADKVALNLANEVAQGRYVSPNSMTVATLLTRFVESKKPPETRQSTYDFYEKLSRIHLIPDLGDKLAGRLRRSEIRSYYIQKEKAGMSPSTTKHLHETLRAALRQAVEDGDLAENPLEGLKAPNVPPRPMTIWTAEQAARFLEMTRDHRLYAAFLLALTTGMRRGEILGLRWQDVNLDAMTLAVEQSFVPTSVGLSVEAPKTEAGKRLVDLGELTVEALRKRFIDQVHERQDLKDGFKETGLVFTQVDGQRITPRRYDRQFDLQVKKAGLPRIRRHDTRHTFITLALGNGGNLNSVAQRVGHADPATTLKIYGHVLPTMQRQVADNIEDLYTQARPSSAVEEGTDGVAHVIAHVTQQPEPK